MSRLIDADELIYRLREIVREMQYEDVADEEAAISAYLDTILCVKIMPTIYPDGDHIRHGHWEFLGPNRFNQKYFCGTCSECKVYSKYIVNTMICPNCGAKMDEEFHDETKE